MMNTDKACNSRGRLVAVDFDGVITNPHNIKAEELTRLGYPVGPTETEREYCVHKAHVPLGVYECAAHVANCTRLMEMPLEIGAKATIGILVACGFQLVIVTSRREDEIPPMLKYLLANDITVNDIINTGRKSKTPVLRSLQPILYVDDSPSKIQELVLGCDSVTPFFYVNAANRHWICRAQEQKISHGNWKIIMTTLGIERAS